MSLKQFKISKIVEELNNTSKPKTIYVLDRNVMSLINDLINKRELNQIKNLPMLFKLYSINGNENYISPLFSIIEGGIGDREDSNQKKITIQRDNSLICSFFNRSLYDDFTSKSQMLWYAQVLSVEDVEVDQPKCNIYLDFFFKSWQSKNSNNSIPIAERLNFVLELLDFAKNIGLSKAHLAVITTFLCIYGEKFAIQVLKPKHPNIHNVYSDIASIFRLSLMRSFAENGEKFIFLTLDKGLEGLFGIFNSLASYHVRYRENGNRITTMGYSLEDTRLPVRVLDKLFE
ncbi:hypothetical protein QR674_12550 [Acinetobacter chinensis]|uniref:Uncharacterized protein n=1 Tax=Acinetobacter chinensis TaxID=2004650 RepID=A0ABU3WHC7_9GAMM|nr:hypothetical protein [Acinetobacter chinensis]MDV2469810.1 hypothetical protein [Acinetobacter chinensis]